MALNRFYYFGARYYAPWLGKWVSVDPKLLLITSTRLMQPNLRVNGYAYCQNQPIIYIDSNGLEQQEATPVASVPTATTAQPPSPGVSSSAPIDIAFWTTGDTRSVITQGGSQGVTRSQMYQMLAQDLVGQQHAYGVANIDAATSILQGLGARGIRVRGVYFVGHGRQGGFFFSGRQHPQYDFYAELDQILQPVPGSAIPSRRFIQALSSVLDRNIRVEIDFLSCYTAEGSLLGELRDELDIAGIPNFRIRGVRDYFNTQFVDNPHGGRTWHNNLWC